MALSLNGILFVVGVIVLGFLLSIPLRDRFFNSGEEGFDGYYAKKHSMPGRGPIEIIPASYSPPKTVAQSGPNPPAQAAPEGELFLFFFFNNSCSLSKKNNFFFVSYLYFFLW